MNSLPSRIQWKDLSIAQANEIKQKIKQSFPYLEFDFVEERIFKKGASGSDADFIEIGVESLFQMVIDLLYNKNY